MIRPATLEDVIRIVDLGELLHAESSYKHMPFSRVKVAKLITLLIVSNGVVFVAEKNGVVVGGIAGGVTEHWFSEEKLGYEYSFFIEPSARHGITAFRLIRAFKAWCAAQGAKTVRMGITTGINTQGTAEFYRSQGFTDAGLLFSVEV